MKTILIVDDELQILKSLRRLFLDADYDLICVQSGEAALEALFENPVDLIISDMRMPEMDGLELLSRVKKDYPGVIRIILSAASDEKPILKSIQKGIAMIYIMKPWSNNDILRTVDRIFETESLLNNGNLLKEFNNISELPTLKSSYRRIVDMTENDADLGDITAAIELDQSIATKILHIANSAYFGVKTGSVKQAVLFLGFNNLRSVIVSTSFFDSMRIPADSMDFARQLQNHAYLTNKIMHQIFKQHLHKEVPEQASAAGLLHNIGMIFMLSHFGEKFGSVIKNSGGEGDLVSLEKGEFPVSHAEAGGFLLRWWEIPYPIVEAALYCHQPMNESVIYPELVSTVHIAQKYASDYMRMDPLCVFQEETFQKIGLDRKEFEDSLDRIGFKK